MKYYIVVQSEEHGAEEIGTYDSEEERQAALTRLMRAAQKHKLKDGIERFFSFREKHDTRLSWAIDNDDGIACRIVDMNDDGVMVCEGVTPDDARFIIHRCVLHDDLVDALKEAQEYLATLLEMSSDEAIDSLVNNGQSVFDALDVVLEKTKQGE